MIFFVRMEGDFVVTVLDQLVSLKKSTLISGSMHEVWKVLRMDFLVPASNYKCSKDYCVWINITFMKIFD